MTIAGSLLGDAATVTFGDLKVDTATKTDSEVTCTSPAHNPGTVDVFVTNSDSKTESNKLPYRYV